MMSQPLMRHRFHAVTTACQYGLVVVLAVLETLLNATFALTCLAVYAARRLVHGLRAIAARPAPASPQAMPF
jgi:hypothetical protein